MSQRIARFFAVLLTGVLLAGGVNLTTVSSASAVEPGADPFYSYSGSKSLASYAPGAVLAQRTVPYHAAGIPLPLRTTQILYRTTDQLGRPVANVTSVVRPLIPIGVGVGRAVSYQSFYDTLNPADSPSRAIKGSVSLGGAITNIETLLFAPMLLKGYSVIVTDTQGQDADFAAGPQYGQMTLDGIRAASQATGTGVSARSKVGMLGYSGGAIATNWAASLAPTYAPDVNSRLVGATEGGVLVAPAHNLTYVSGTPVWGGVLGMALVGVTRAFDIDLAPYLSDYGTTAAAKLSTASIINVLGQYPGFTYERFVKPEYADPNSDPQFVAAFNALNMGSAPSPTIPMQIRQGAGGEIEGTPGNKPGIGAGDGVMIAGDVRSLARQYCEDGTRVSYKQYDALSHVPAAVAWLPEALVFLDLRFAGITTPSSCGSIPAGNSLAPEVVR